MAAQPCENVKFDKLEARFGLPAPLRRVVLGSLILEEDQRRRCYEEIYQVFEVAASEVFEPTVAILADLRSLQPLLCGLRVQRCQSTQCGEVTVLQGMPSSFEEAMPSMTQAGRLPTLWPMPLTQAARDIPRPQDFKRRRGSRTPPAARHRGHPCKANVYRSNHNQEDWRPL